MHRVSSIAIGLVGDISGIVHDVGIIAGAAQHRVGTSQTVESVIAAKTGQRVDARVAGDDVAEVIASAIDRGRAGQRQVLD